MKHINKLFVLVSIGFILLFAACDKREYEIPTIKTPTYETTSEQITIANLKTLVEPKILGRNSSETNNNFGYLQNPANANILDENGNRNIVSLSEVGISNKHL